MTQIHAERSGRRTPWIVGISGMLAAATVVVVGLVWWQHDWGDQFPALDSERLDEQQVVLVDVLRREYEQPGDGPKYAEGVKEAWCADFVSYCYTKAGKKLNDPWTPSLLQTLKNNGTWNRNNPKPGDIIMFDWTPGSGRLAEHTGLVEKVYRSGGKTWVQTIEGNSGDMVRRNRYAVGDPRVSFGTIR